MPERRVLLDIETRVLLDKIVELEDALAHYARLHGLTPKARKALQWPIGADGTAPLPLDLPETDPGPAPDPD